MVLNLLLTAVLLLQFMQNLCVTGSTGYKLPDLVGDWTHLLLEDDVAPDPSRVDNPVSAEASFSGKRAQAGEWHKAFMRELVALGKGMEEKNARRSQEPFGRPFVACDPRTFECSVSI